MTAPQGGDPPTRSPHRGLRTRAARPRAGRPGVAKRNLPPEQDQGGLSRDAWPRPARSTSSSRCRSPGRTSSASARWRYYDASGSKIGTSSPSDVASKAQGTILFATTYSDPRGRPRLPDQLSARQAPQPRRRGRLLDGRRLRRPGATSTTRAARHCPRPRARPRRRSPTARRSSAASRAGCPTLLEVSDDTDKSSADFASGTPHPRNTHTAPTERACPNTTITSGPSGHDPGPHAHLQVQSSLTPATFKCRLDGGSLKPCSSPAHPRPAQPGPAHLQGQRHPLRAPRTRRRPPGRSRSSR